MINPVMYTEYRLATSVHEMNNLAREGGWLFTGTTVPAPSGGRGVQYLLSCVHWIEDEES